MTRRSYLQFCGLARALDVVGERWTLLLVRELLLGERRYSDLLASLPGLTTNLLAARLKDLTRLGLVTTNTDGAYALTDEGAALEPAIMELARWGGRYLKDGPRKKDRIDLSWALLSLKRRYRGGLDLVLAIEADGAWYSLTFEPSWLRVRKGRPQKASATLHSTSAGLRGLLMGGPSLEELIRSRAASVDGAVKVVERALGAFLPAQFASLPPPKELSTRFWPSPRQSRRLE